MSWRTSNRRKRLPSNWAGIRKVVMERDGYRCRWLVGGKRCRNKATQVHHVYEAGANGGVERDDPRFLIAICDEHHDLVTRVYAQERKEAKRSKVDFTGHPGLL